MGEDRLNPGPQQPDVTPAGPPLSAPGDVDLAPLLGRGRLLVALDFDGVVAPLTDDPAHSTPLPATARAIAGLAALPDTTVGFISGRPLGVLKDLTDPPPQAVFIGSHGAEEDFGAEAPRASAGDGTSDDDGAPALTPAERAVLDTLDAAFARISAEAPAEGEGELRLERKPLGRTFHVRGTTGARRAFFVERVDALLADVPSARRIHGHEVIEYAVRKTTKGQGLARMIDRTGARAALYIGDDTTDEDAFALLHRVRAELPGLGVKVGPGATAADVRIPAPTDVSVLLARLLESRAPRVA